MNFVKCNTKILKFLYVIIGLTFIIWSVTTFLHKPASSQFQPKLLPQTSLGVGDYRLAVEMATTEAERTQGLSGRESLLDGHGMLFFFDTPNLYGFWMKEMKFAIDIIWINEDWQVVEVKRGVSPESYPEVFYPRAMAKYVLELKAGQAEHFGIDIGTKLNF